MRKVKGSNEKVSKSSSKPKQSASSSTKKVEVSITLEELDKKVAVLNTVVDRIENNHLEHIKKDIDKLDFRIWAILTGVIVQLTATVVTLVL